MLVLLGFPPLRSLCDTCPPASSLTSALGAPHAPRCFHVWGDHKGLAPAALSTPPSGRFCDTSQLPPPLTWAQGAPHPLDVLLCVWGDRKGLAPALREVPPRCLFDPSGTPIYEWPPSVLPTMVCVCPLGLAQGAS